MKRCPECRREYDNSMMFCLDDGAGLFYGPATADETATAILRVADGEGSTGLQRSDETPRPGRHYTHRTRILAGVVMVLIFGSGIIAYRYFAEGKGETAYSETRIRSLSVLPLRPLDASDNYLGMGIADAIIRRMSQTGKLIVPPTSAVRRYLSDETDPLTAARQLNTEAVLEGSIQRAGDRLRVSVNLLRTADGASLWNERFDLKMSDIFTVQDTVSQRVASSLSLRLDSSQQSGLTKRYTSDPAAYEYYQKAVYASSSSASFGLKNEEALAVIELLKKAIDIDPSYALAHAQLAYMYARMATFTDPTEPKWSQLLQSESDLATQLDPQLAETHLARSLILWSAYGGFQLKPAIRELITAQQVDPNVGHADLANLYGHVGLKEISLRESERAMEIDPASGLAKGQFVNQYWLWGDYDQWAVQSRRYLAKDTGDPEKTLWYLLGKGRVEEAQRESPDKTGKNKFGDLMSTRLVLLAMKGDFAAAEREIPALLNAQPIQDPRYHHITYDIACIYALQGKSSEAVKWLRKTAESGYPCYPRFESDHYLDRIRESAEFVQFMAEMKGDWESYNSEFGQK